MYVKILHVFLDYVLLISFYVCLKLLKDSVDSASADDAIKEVFNSFAGQDKEIDWKKLKSILDLLLKHGN